MPWTHNLIILSQSKQPEEREFYLRLAAQEKWSSRELERQFKTALLARTVVQPAKVSAVLRQSYPAALNVFKDSYLIRARDTLMIFNESLSKFVRCYEYVAQLVDFGDPELEAFASYARLLRKRLKGIASEQVDLGDLTLTHYKASEGATLTGLLQVAQTPALYGITDNGLRDPRDREQKYLAELIEKLNDAFGKGINSKDQVLLAVHVSETLRDDAMVMAQVQNNSREQAMKANLPGAAVTAIVGAMQPHQNLATRLLSDDLTRGSFLDFVYEVLKRHLGGDLLSAARG